ncbi:unnamed protein product [Brugia timori]|uniref:Uncharacterized protein n=1 Tax=Brugia timori TaxID=42155 RepID=A0A3P7WAY1_9BILA|nr:unnamed protein product [Brugia timori]
MAECESSCIENSPAVEVSPLKFIPDEIHYGCIKESSKDRATKSQIVGSSSSTNSVKEACRNQFLSSELTYNCVKATREKSLNDKRKDGCTMTNVALRDGLLNNNLPDNYTDCFCDNDVKSRDNPNAFVSPTAVTLSGLTTSSGYQYFPDKFPDKDAELSEQFVDMTIIQKFVFPGYSFQLVKATEFGLTDTSPYHLVATAIFGDVYAIWLKNFCNILKRNNVLNDTQTILFNGRYHQ